MIPDNKVTITCPNCKQVWSVPIPLAELSNNLRSSCVTIAHEQLIRCPSAQCRSPFIMIIKGAQLAIGVQLVGDDIVEQLEGSRLVKSALELVQ